MEIGYFDKVVPTPEDYSKMKSSIMGMQASVKWDPMQALFATFRFSQLLNGTKNNDLAIELSLNLNFAEPLGKQFAYTPNQNSNMVEMLKKTAPHYAVWWW